MDRAPRARRHPGPRTLAWVVLATIATGSAGTLAGQGPGAVWKDCAFNDVLIGCVDQQLPDGIRLVWKDGLAMTYRQTAPGQPGAPVDLRDQLGALWRRQVLAQGNTVLTNLASGARIVVPLRFPCPVPLKGEVGYCRP